MTIKEAIKSIATHNTLHGICCQDIGNDETKLNNFVKWVKKQYFERKQSERLITIYGKEEIETIVNYKK